MKFNSLSFVIFFIVVYGLLIILKNEKHKKSLLLVASYFFYGYWDYRFLSLIGFSTIVDYFVGKKLDEDKIDRKLLIIISLVINLGLLGVFKYFNFFIDSFNSVFGGNLSSLNIILPVGISFYTFQTLSYSLDVYRRKINHVDSLIDFALFVSFFPQLVAGPIVRAKDFLPQLKNKIVLSSDNYLIGFQIFLFGAVKKVLIADRLAYYVDNVFVSPRVFDSLTIWLAVVSYAVQIYADFSGYSDMAIGISRMLGFTLPKNFDVPYVARNITEFWRRWHISLSSWLKDYLYISLGGNRKGRIRTYLNLLITMVLGGLWHGASYNFVLWGTLHGLALAIHKFYMEFIEKNTKVKLFPLNWIATLMFVSTLWVPFRAESFSLTLDILKKMYIFSDGISYLYFYSLVMIPLVSASHLFKVLARKDDYLYFKSISPMSFGVVLSIVLMLLLFSPSTPSPFIYFQF